ncbi:hypothetical protein BD410DRAFT_802459 [Rickenella mellea]|uniref:Uncharacterized protein n=1 Tax=Rickenella mellea TaxID=50990 RepID=A0A4Y7Q974_9AGAM|nr:hypothetical protein BD410DRAFT_802459 [Rickenella mellea]
MNANQRKDRLYAQLASNLKLLKQNAARTTDLAECLQEDLLAMRTFAGVHAAQFMTVASSLETRTVGDQSVEDTSRDSASKLWHLRDTGHGPLDGKLGVKTNIIL